MNLNVAGWDLKRLGEFCQSLVALSSSTGEALVLRAGAGGTLDISTLQTLSAERPAKSDKSEGSPQPESPPSKLLLQVTRHANGFTKATVFLQDGTEALADVELPSWKGDRARLAYKTLTFSVDTSRKPTSTDTTYSKEQLLTLLRRSDRWKMFGQHDETNRWAERFINGL